MEDNIVKSAITLLGQMPIKIEDYTVAITVSPNPQGLPKGIKAQFSGTWKYLKKILEKCSDYYITVEFTLQGNIHYHGALKIKDKAEYQKAIRKIRTIVGNTFIRYIDDPERWFMYCVKDVEHYKKLLPVNLPMINLNRDKDEKGKGAPGERGRKETENTNEVKYFCFDPF